MEPLEIVAGAEKIVEFVRDYSRSQRDFWQRIPLLALEADGRDGFYDNHYRAYRQGFWALDTSVSNGYYSVYVDLATGELVDAYSASASFSVCDLAVPKDSVLTPARKEDVLKLAFNLDQLNAKKIVSALKKQAKQKYPSYNDPLKQEVWRSKTRKELNLPELYVR